MEDYDPNELLIVTTGSQARCCCGPAVALLLGLPLVLQAVRRAAAPAGVAAAGAAAATAAATFAAAAAAARYVPLPCPPPPPTPPPPFPLSHLHPSAGRAAGGAVAGRPRRQPPAQAAVQRPHPLLGKGHPWQRHARHAGACALLFGGCLVVQCVQHGMALPPKRLRCVCAGRCLPAARQPAWHGASAGKCLLCFF